MGMKPRPTRTLVDVVRKAIAAHRHKREPIKVASLGAGDTSQGWHALHQFIHDFEDVWDHLDQAGKDSFLKAMSLFVGGMSATARDKQQTLARIQSLVRHGFTDYEEQRNSICQAVTFAHIFEHGDQTVN